MQNISPKNIYKNNYYGIRNTSARKINFSQNICKIEKSLEEKEVEKLVDGFVNYQNGELFNKCKSELQRIVKPYSLGQSEVYHSTFLNTADDIMKDQRFKIPYEKNDFYYSADAGLGIYFEPRKHKANEWGGNRNSVVSASLSPDIKVATVDFFAWQNFFDRYMNYCFVTEQLRKYSDDKDLDLFEQKKLYNAMPKKLFNSLGYNALFLDRISEAPEDFKQLVVYDSEIVKPEKVTT